MRGSDAQEDTKPYVFSILAVCTANICRSPMVEYLLRGQLASECGTESDLRFEVSSTGIRGWDGAEMDPLAAAELRRLGHDATGFRARSFTAEHAERADIILTATTDHRRAVLQDVPHALRRTFTLLEFAHLVSAVPEVEGAAAGDPREVVRRAAASRGAARLGSYDLTDPYGHDADVHRATADIVRTAVEVASFALAGEI